MLIDDINVNDDLFQIYCHSIVCVYRSPTKSADQTRRNAHIRLLESCDKNPDTAFHVALENTVYELIADKIGRIS